MPANRALARAPPGFRHMCTCRVRGCLLAQQYHANGAAARTHGENPLSEYLADMPPGTPVASSQFHTFIDVLEERCNAQPNDRAYTFLKDDGTEATKLTFAEVRHRAKAIAKQLMREHQQGTGARMTAILLFPPGLDLICAFYGCLYAGVIGVPVYPPSTRAASDLPRLKSELSRMAAIVRDAQVHIGLTTVALRWFLSSLSLVPANLLATISQVSWIATDHLHLQHRRTQVAQGSSAEGVNSETVAFLQYSSGSTGDPKGVAVTHGNLVHNCSNNSDRVYSFSSTPGGIAKAVGVMWLPPYHDMGLIGGILTTMLAGVHLVMFSPLAFLQRPLTWLEALSKYKATHTGVPNFALDYTTRKVMSEEKKSLDLSHLRVMVLGGETNRTSSITRFHKAFAPQGISEAVFKPGYALAENTLTATITPYAAPHCTVLQVDRAELESNDRAVEVRDPPSAASVDCMSDSVASFVSAGCPAPGVTIAIVASHSDKHGSSSSKSSGNGSSGGGDDDSLAALPECHVGEILVCGPSVASGYFGRPQQSEVTFGARIHLKDDSVVIGDHHGSDSWLRSGDLGFVCRGELFITGRQKDLIISNGRNLHPQDVELTVTGSSDMLRKGCAAVFAVTVCEGQACAQARARAGSSDVVEERAVAVVEARKEWTGAGSQTSAHDLINDIFINVSKEHNISLFDVVIVDKGCIVKTTSGKIRRFQVRDLYLNGGLRALHSHKKGAARIVSHGKQTITIVCVVLVLAMILVHNWSS